MTTTGAPAAATISFTDTLALLDGPFRAMAEGVAGDEYAFWLGSGISLSRMPKLALVAKAVLTFLQKRTDASDANCRFGQCLNATLNLAGLSADEWKRIDFSQPVDNWPDADVIAGRLVLNYARMLDQSPAGEEQDFLLWEAVDVVHTYDDPRVEPDAEHLSMAALVMEGVASDIASANWDPLIERAVEQLAGGVQVLSVCVRPEETRQKFLRGRLYKFHGCARLAGQNPGLYREKLVARQSQINGWHARGENAVVLAKLVDMLASKPTLMLGLSAQDSNIQGMFVAAQQRMAWPWPSHPPACIVSDNTLGVDHEGLLRNVYATNYTATTKGEIHESALIKAFAKPLLTALWVYVVSAKLCALIGHALVKFTPGERSKLQNGVKDIRNLVAATAQPSGHEAFMREALSKSARIMSLFRDGQDSTGAALVYLPLSTSSVHQLVLDPALATLGIVELAVAASLLGIGARTVGWELSARGTSTTRSGALRLQSKGVGLEMFFAANAQSAVRLLSNGHVANDDDAVVVHSHAILPPMARSPRSKRGRTGRTRLRELSITDLIASSSTADELVQRFREELGL